MLCLEYLLAPSASETAEGLKADLEKKSHERMGGL